MKRRRRKRQVNNIKTGGDNNIDEDVSKTLRGSGKGGQANR